MVSDKLRGGDAHMIGGNELSFLSGGGDESAAGEMVGSAQQSSGALLDGGHGRLGEELLSDAGDLEMVVEIGVHLLSGDALEMAAGNDSRGEGDGGPVEEEIEEVVLPCEDDGEIGFGVAFELGEGVELGQNFNSQEGGFVDDEHRFLLAVACELQDLAPDNAKEGGPGKGVGVDLELR
jgi:hypothetical protein